MTSINHDDPRLTAYVLGELDTDDARAVQQAAEHDPLIQAELDAIGQLSGQLKSELSGEGALALTADQKRNLEAAMRGDHDPLPFDHGGRTSRADNASVNTRSPDFWRGAAALTGMAALVALGIFLPRSLFDGGSIHSGVAINDSSEDRSALDKPAIGDRASDSLRHDQMQPESDRFGGGRIEARESVIEEAVNELEITFDVRVDPDASVAGKAGTIGMLEGGDVSGADSPTAISNLASAPEIMRKELADEIRAVKKYENKVRDQAWSESAGNSPAAVEGEEPVRLNFARRSRAAGEPLLGDVPVLGSTLRSVESESSPGAPARPALQDRSIFDDDDQLLDAEQSSRPESGAPTPIVHNPFVSVTGQPLSTFSIDVDTASYSNMRGYLRHGEMPPASIARVEEMINYFHYDYVAPSPRDEHPFRSNVEVAPCPWSSENRLVRVGIKGMEIPNDDRPATNLVFLVDVSGSMNDRNKLPLVKDGLKMMVENLTVDDKVALVTYAGNAGVVLDSTSCFHRDQILAAIDNLGAGGSTHGSQGITRAYEIAAANFIKGAMNRVILATDGDFNVGITDNDALVALIEEEARSGVFLNVLGFGRGNLKDARLEQLADRGNGVYAYIDDIHEARKVFVEEMSGTLVTIAKDVKIQVEFNPAFVKSYRLIGYENRMLAARDFNDDTKDAGEIGAGHTVTALYEVVPGNALQELATVGAGDQPGEQIAKPQAAEVGVDPLRYQADGEDSATHDEWLTVKIRYKLPEGNESTLVEYPVTIEDATRAASFSQASDDFRFATSVAAMGMILRRSPHVGDVDFNRVLGWAMESLGEDKTGDRLEFVELVKQARELASQSGPGAD